MATKELRRTYNPNYFSIDYILASQTLISCFTQVNLPHFGFLAPEFESQDLPMGVNIQLPLWAARVMCKPRRAHVAVSIPSEFQKAYDEVVMEGKPVTTDLKKVHSQYFEVGHLCTSLFHQDVGDLAEMIPEVLMHRILCIGGAAIPNEKRVSFYKEYNSEPIQSELMDLLELQIFQDAENHGKSILRWMEPVTTVGTSLECFSGEFRQESPEDNDQMLP